MSNISNISTEAHLKHALGINELDYRINKYEMSFQPFINQFEAHSIVSNKGPSAKAAQLVRNLFLTIENFIKKCSEVSIEFPNLQSKINNEIQSVKARSQMMLVASDDFTNDTSSFPKRMIMTKTARDLLSAVARLLAISDMAEREQSYLWSLEQKNSTIKIEEKNSWTIEQINSLNKEHNKTNIIHIKEELREPVNVTEHIKTHLVIMKSESNHQELLLHFKTFNQNLVYLSNHIKRHLGVCFILFFFY